MDFRRLLKFSELIWLGLALWVSIASLCSVTFLMDRLEQSFEKNSHQLIGADLLIRGDQPLDTYFEKHAIELGLETAKTIIFPTMVRVQEASKLVSLKAVSAQYPLRGQLTLQNDTKKLSEHEIWIDEQLAKQLNISLGSEIELGNSRFRVKDILLKELDRGAAFMNFSPRVMIREEDLAATQLLGLGSRASYRLLVASNPQRDYRQGQEQIGNYENWAKNYIQEKSLRGVKLEGLENSQPIARKTLQQAKKLLSLAALFTAMIAAVGIALSSQRYVQKNTINVAVWRCFGASQKQILWRYMRPLIYVGILATFFGLVTGYIGQELLMVWVGNLVIQDVMQPSLLPVLWAILVAFLLLSGFSGPSLLQLTQISPITTIRQLEFKRSHWYILSIISSLVTYAVLLVAISRTIYLSLVVLGCFVIGTLLIMTIAWIASKQLGKFIRQLPKVPLGLLFTSQRLIGGTKYTVIQIAALSVAMLALLLLMVIRTDVISTWQSAISPDAPNRFILNITPEQKDQVTKSLEELGSDKNLDLYPMVRGRLTKINNQFVSSESFSDDNAKRLIDREFNLSYTTTIPLKNTIIAGQWFGTKTNVQEISMESGIMKTLGLQLGDQLSFDILGSSLDVIITSIRKLDWNSMRVNFFAIVPPSLLLDAPQTWIVAYHQNSSTKVDDMLVEKFPNISIINVEQTIGQVNQMIGQLFNAVQALFLFALCAGVLVLFITMFGIQSKRFREIAILKTYGADKNYLTRIWFYEFLIIGTLAGLLSGNIAGISAWIIVKYFLEVDMFYPFWLIAFAILLGITCSLLSSLYLKLRVKDVSTVKILQSI